MVRCAFVRFLEATFRDRHRHLDDSEMAHDAQIVAGVVEDSVSWFSCWTERFIVSQLKPKKSTRVVTFRKIQADDTVCTRPMKHKKCMSWFIVKTIFTLILSKPNSHTQGYEST